MSHFYVNIDPLRECPNCGQNRVRANEETIECVIDVPPSTTPGFNGATQRWIRTYEVECDTKDCWNVWKVTVKL